MPCIPNISGLLCTTDKSLDSWYDSGYQLVHCCDTLDIPFLQLVVSGEGLRPLLCQSSGMRVLVHSL